MKRKIGDLLISFGISPSHFGFNYIIEAVLLWDGKTPTTKIYEKVAEKYGTNSRSTERCIRHAFGNMSKDAKDNYFKGIKERNGDYIAYINWRECEGD